MPKLVIKLIVAVIAFAIGLTISRAVTNLLVEKPIQPVAIADPILTKPQIGELPDPPAEPNFTKESDLVVALKVDQTRPNAPTHELRYIKLARNGATIIELYLGEYVDESEITLNFRDLSARYRILQRYRTSMSVSAEGPHLDLIDWRHYDSPWTLLESLGPNRFRTIPVDQMEVRFPKTSKADIVKEVRRQVGNDGSYILECAQSCNGPTEGACYVAISSIYLRIQKQVSDRWTDVGLVDFRLAMGC